MRGPALAAIVVLVNENHDQLLGTPEWAAYLHDEVLPAATRGVGLGDDMLEIGPGPGAATSWLRERVRRLVAVDLALDSAAALRERFSGTNVSVVAGDATELGYPDGSFDSVGTFTMLHHVPTRRLQDAIFAEALRVLRPGGTLVGSDSLASDRLHHFHEGDTYNPVEPSSLLARLQTLGFAEVSVTVGHTLLFWARRGE
jgi:ubiquinone/menaquinone biosynthesis C-methylase UbiE